jgi:hypothetical protein
MKHRGKLMDLFLKGIKRYWAIYLVAVALFLLITWLVYLSGPVNVDWQPGNTTWSFGVDWKGAFRPAVFRMLSGQSPYGHAVFNPPWVFILLIPFALLSPPLGAAAIFTSGLFFSAWAAIRIGAKPGVAVAFALSPLVIGNASNGNIDWMVMLGATLPPQFGLFLVLAKPQIGAGIVLFWLIEAWRDGGWRRVLWVFGPVGLAFPLSFALYGLWPLKAFGMMGTNPYIFSAWPYSIPFGIALLIHAIRSRTIKPAIVASPLITPYIMLDSWSIAMFGIVNTQLEFWITWVFLWILRLVFHGI